MKTKANFLSEKRLIRDSIHENLEIPELLMAIVDTPQFQRLRNLKQLGVTDRVYPSATHTRFEHSLGVCHLAGVFAKHLQEQIERCDDYHQIEDLRVSDQDVLCVMTAGLCHDLGHGPLSHVFDGIFLPSMNSENKWKHEKGSIDMFDYLLKENSYIREKLCKEAGLDDVDFIFIKELIYGPLHAEVDFANVTFDNWPFEGRSAYKSFLYQIVANKWTGIDVDKFEYFLRDASNCGQRYNFDYKRYISLCKVLQMQHDNLYHICVRDKNFLEVNEIFVTRASLHRKIYQHKTCVNIEVMYKEALQKADKHLQFIDENGVHYSLSETVNNMAAFQQVDDSVFKVIQLKTMSSDDAELKESYKLIEKVERRQFYKFIGEVVLDGVKYSKKSKDCIAEEIAKCDKRASGEREKLQIDTDWIVVHVSQIDFGASDGSNPVEKMGFYTKENPSIAYKIKKSEFPKLSTMISKSTCEQLIRMFWKGPDNLIDAAKACLTEWAKITHQTEPKHSIALTPEKPPEFVRETTPIP